MDILLVGTGAADYEACLTCPCRNCLEARSLGGRNLRTYASALVDDSLLIDCGKTVPWRLAELDVDLAAIAHLFITHAHGDHLDPEGIRDLSRVAGGDSRLQVYGNERVVEQLDDCGADADLHEMAVGDEVQARGLGVLALPAKHDWENQQSLNFVVTGGDSTLLYATDTTWPEERWWDLLAEHHIDVAVVEATFGPLDEAGHPDCLTHHLNWGAFVALVEELRERDILGEDAPAWATHLSLHWLPVHDRYAAEVNRPGAELAYDGLRLTIRA